MRPGQNRRVRGRNRNKGPNPLTRTYESNGPDVKIRGTAQHVADKYAQLARDAQASGDPVSAENYLQHAEHYYRMIAAAQEQFRQQYGALPRGEEDGDEDADEDSQPNGYGYPAADRAPMQQDGMDPSLQPQPYEMRNGGGMRQDRGDRPDRGERQDRGPQPRFDRGDRQERGERQDRAPRQDRSNRNDRQERGGERRERYARGGGEGRPDYQPRQDGSRQDGPRQDGPRQDGPRQDGPRQDGGRQDGNGRFEQPRFDAPRDYARQEARNEARNEAPRQETVRQDAPRAERQVEAREPEIANDLPAFLTNPIRQPVAVPDEPREAPASVSPELPNGEAEPAPAPRPVRRRRTRAMIEADAAAAAAAAAEKAGE